MPNENVCEFAGIHLLDTVWNVDREYTYRIPESLRDRVKKGSLVVIPFGNGNVKKTGFVVSVGNVCFASSPKEIISVLDYGKYLPKESVGLSRFMKQRCFCTVGSAVRIMLPPGVNTKRSIWYSVGEEPEKFSDDESEEIYRYVSAEDKITHFELVKIYSEEKIKKLVKTGVLIKLEAVCEKENSKTEIYCSLGRLPQKSERISDGRKRVISALSPEGNEKKSISLKNLCELAEVSQAVVKGLEKSGIVVFENKAVIRGIDLEDIDLSNGGNKRIFSSEMLNIEQKEAYSTLCGLMDSDEAKAALLFGVTGSGKTSVIIGAVSYALSKGKTAIVMLPEIGLTSQAISIFVSYFGEKCALLHSMLSEGERIDAYRRIISGEAKVVIGTRSAVFAPLENIGVIVLDEEQETSYKSEKTPKYHARDIARYRCGVNKALMLLASATPSVESYYKGIKGIYTLVKLEKRYGNMPLPKVIVADLRTDREEGERGMLGGELMARIRETKERDEQSILFVNRRGHSSHVGCHSCGFVYSCPNCSVSLTYHAYTGTGKGKLTCHYCGYTINKPSKCPSCDSIHLNYSGYGTQLLQEELEERLREYKTIRMDADTTSKKSSHKKLLKSFRNKEADILYGTQMIAKGFDFPNVTLVGVVLADSVLYMNDFRAGERTFSLITQLIGRAGRGTTPGNAVVQTYNPDHQVLKLAITQNYEKFFESEIALRKAVVFPPFCEIAIFSVSSKDETVLSSAALKIDEIYHNLLNEYNNSITAVKFGPFREGIYKINGTFRQKLVIKYRECAEVRELFSRMLTQFLELNIENVKIEIDINPLTI